MAQAEMGARDTRGEWRPAEPHRTPPLFVLPPRPAAFLKWLFGYPGYFFPWTAAYMAIAVGTWFWLTPEIASMRTFEPGWIAAIFLRNLGLLLLIAGSWHLRLYVQRAQAQDYKYNAKWLSKDTPAFLFRNQLWDNMFWSIASGCTIWSIYEIVTMWAHANGYIPYVDWREHPVWCVVLFCLVPLIREVHFYAVHRLIHFQPLYRWVHYLHHKNINFGPWSGLSMHPVEHLLYFSGVLVHWVIPSHPLHAIFHMQHAAFTPAQGHTGFDELVVAGDTKIPNHNYVHYLHHRYFKVNYGGDLSVPLDKWFGTEHDGSPEADARLRGRK